ncbi:MAG: hypothetical protein M0022_09125 [Desulfobacteraceae bacterium]|nr:hypothetical protein [Desulfobacteraceae bacterium]
MENVTTVHKIIEISFNAAKPSLIIESDWIIIAAVIIFLLLAIYVKRNFSKWFRWHEMEIEISGTPKVAFKVERNNENLYIANRIYIELTTRKAAIPVDENKDVIEEVYDSWYKLFGIIRDEIKSLPGEYLREHDPTSALLGLTRKILNEALRPHLTEYQAKFRRWLEIQKTNPKNKDKSPQELQREYPDFENLVKSMKEVNKILIAYADELDKLIKGK